MWATVPSLRDRGHPQALHTISTGLLRNMPEAVLTKSDDVRDPRSYRPENFTVRTDVRNWHVLLIDDTWTTGSHAESAAAALKRAGAAAVTLLVLARWLDPGRGNTGAFMREELTEDFDPDRCPFGPTCPRPSSIRGSSRAVTVTMHPTQVAALGKPGRTVEHRSGSASSAGLGEVDLGVVLQACLWGRGQLSVVAIA